MNIVVYFNNGNKAIMDSRTVLFKTKGGLLSYLELKNPGLTKTELSSTVTSVINWRHVAIVREAVEGEFE